ncbi:hypothetical protein Tco_0468206 [Tanacetum coccineum]
MGEDKESDEAEEVEEDDESELKKHLVIKKDEDIAIDAIPLATKLLVIIDYKLHKEGMMVHYQLIRADGSSKRYSSMIRMLQGIDKEDLEALWRIVKTKYSDIRPEDEFERVLWGDLKVMFEPDKRSDVWRILQGYRVTIWKLIDSSGVHFVRGGLLGLKRLHGFLEVTNAQGDLHTLFKPDDKSEIWMNRNEYNLISWSLCDFCGVHILLMQNGIAIHMLTEKKYPLSQEMISKMLSKRLEVDQESTQAYELLKFIRSQVKK